MRSQLNLFTGEPVICSVEKDPTKSGLEEMEDKLLAKYTVKVSAIIDYLADIGLPKKGEQYRLVTRRSFNAIELVQYIAKKEKISMLNMAIYSINFQAATVLLDLLRRRKVGGVQIMMSNLRNKAHREKEEIIKEKFSKHPKIELFFCSSHAKMMACETEKREFLFNRGFWKFGLQ